MTTAISSAIQSCRDIPTRVRCLSEPPNAARIVGTRMKTLNRRCQGRTHEKTGDYISAPLDPRSATAGAPWVAHNRVNEDWKSTRRSIRNPR